MIIPFIPTMRTVDSLPDQFAPFLQNARTRSFKQFQFSLLIAALIAVLLWRTQWISLRPGLLILLCGQLALAAAFIYRVSTVKAAPAQSREDIFVWFRSEEKFVRVSASGESVMRTIGFAVLAYGFWTATHILGLTLLLGVAYPIVSYFGMARRNTRQILKRLEQQRQELR